MAIALVFSQNLAVLRAPAALADVFINFSDSDVIRVLAILALLLIVGCIMEAAPNILLLAPILVSIGTELGIDPAHFGVIIVSTLAVGFITPPIGLNLFVASAISGAPFSTIAREAFNLAKPWNRENQDWTAMLLLLEDVARAEHLPSIYPEKKT